MTALILRRDLGCLRPVDEAGEAALRKIKHGDLVTCEIKRPRNLQHHRLFYALMNLIHANQEHYATVEDIVTVFKFRCGHTKKIQTATGIVETPLSISFAAMDQDQFAAFYERAIDFVLTEIIPGLKRADLERELMEFAR